MRASRVFGLCVLLSVAAAADDSTWEDNADTTKIWEAVSSGDSGEVKKLIEENEAFVNTRSADGRGALW